MFRDRLEKIAERYPPKVNLSLADLADMANTLVDGGIIMSRVLVDKTILPRQILLYRDFICTAFLDTALGGRRKPRAPQRRNRKSAANFFAPSGNMVSPHTF